MSREAKIFIETDRLILRNIKPADLDIIYDYRNNERCSKYQRAYTKTREGLNELINKHTEDELLEKDSIIIAVYQILLKNRLIRVIIGFYTPSSSSDISSEREL